MARAATGLSSALLLPLLLLSFLLLCAPASSQTLTPSPGLKRLKNDAGRAAKHIQDGAGSKTYKRLAGTKG